MRRRFIYGRAMHRALRKRDSHTFESYTDTADLSSTWIIDEPAGPSVYVTMNEAIAMAEHFRLVWPSADQ